MQTIYGFQQKQKEFAFYNFFLFFAKNSGAKKQKIEIDHIFEFFLKFLQFFQRKTNFEGFF